MQKTDKPIEMQFRELTHVGPNEPRIRRLDGSQDRTNPFAAAWGDKSAMQLFAKLLRTHYYYYYYYYQLTLQWPHWWVPCHHPRTSFSFRHHRTQTVIVGQASHYIGAWDWQAASVTSMTRHGCRRWGRHTAVTDWTHCRSQHVDCVWTTTQYTVHIAVGLRLGANICEPHQTQCPCRVMTYAKGLHGLSCNWGTGRSARHHNLNDLVWRALGKANVPSVKEPTGLFRSDGKRPNGLTLIPWKNGKCVTWDVTVTDTLAQSYLSSISSTSGGAAEAAADWKSLKYALLSQTYIFVPISMETFGPLNMAGFQFLNKRGKRISQESDDFRESAFLYQRLSMTIQRFNAVAIQGTFAMRTPTEDDI